MEIEEKTKYLGKQIKSLRIAKGLLQGEAAKRIGVSQAYLSNIESGRNHITLRNLFKLQEVLGCSMCDFFKDMDRAEAKHDFNLRELKELLELIKR